MPFSHTQCQPDHKPTSGGEGGRKRELYRAWRVDYTILSEGVRVQNWLWFSAPFLFYTADRKQIRARERERETRERERGGGGERGRWN